MSHELSYAGVPFLSDLGTSFRTPGDAAIQQPAEDLLDELERRIPREFLDDFSVSDRPSLADTDLGLSYHEGIQPRSSLRIGDWYYPCHATRWGVFRGLMSSTLLKAVLATTGGTSPAEFVMKAFPSAPGDPDEDDYTLSTSMYMLPARPLAQFGQQFDGLFLVTLVDERYYWRGTKVELASPEQTWSGIIRLLEAALGVSIANSEIEDAYGVPDPDSPLRASAAPAALVLDCVAANLGRVLVRDLDGTYSLLTYAESASRVAASRGEAGALSLVAGGDLYDPGTYAPAGSLASQKNMAVPARVVVTFPYYVAGYDPVPHFYDTRSDFPKPTLWNQQSYGAQYPISVTPAQAGHSSVVGVGDHTVRACARAVAFSEEDLTPINLAGLQALALRIATDVYDAKLTAALDEVYPGTYAWSPEGVHDLIWTYSPRRGRATTRVLCRAWTDVVERAHHATPDYTYLPGAGGPQVAQSWRDQSAEVVLPRAVAYEDSYWRLDRIGGLPTQNRWRGQVDDEVVLFEGTSGGVGLGSESQGYRVDVVSRGYDGTTQADHAVGAVVIRLTPDVSHGNNLVTLEKMQFAYPGETTPGGIQEVRVAGQTQTVQCLCDSPYTMSGVNYYSGVVNTFDTAKVSGQHFPVSENVWILDRNYKTPNSGQRYDGQLLGYTYGPYPAPLYGVGVGMTLEGTPTELASNVCPIFTRILPGDNVTFDITPGFVTINSDASGAGIVTSVSTSQDLTAAYQTVLVANASNITLTLPLAADVPGKRYTVKKTSANDSTVTILPSGSDLIEGEASLVLFVVLDVVTIQSDNSSGWYVIDDGLIPHYAAMTRSVSAQTIPNGADTLIEFDTIEANNAGLAFTGVSARFEVRRDGWYAVDCGWQANASPTSSQCWIYVELVRVANDVHTNSVGATTANNLSRQVYLTAGQNVNFHVRQDSTGPADTLLSAGQVPRMQITEVR